MQFHGDFPNKRSFAETSSLGSPEKYKWWRKVSATKSKPPSSEKVKKSPFSTLQNRGNINHNNDNDNNSFKIKENAESLRKIPSFSTVENKDKSVKPGSKNVVFNEKMEKTQFVNEVDDEERVRVWSIIKMFREKCKDISLRKGQISGNGRHRVDFIAKEELTKQGKLCISSSKVVGPIPGINVGDKFKYRVELIIVGIHGRIQHGIDYMMYKGNSVATCIVAKEGYDDKLCDSEMITYVGEGGGFWKNKQDGGCKDQKLTYGNLALKNSMVAKTDVRVVRGLTFGAGLYVYDGLYRVVSYEEKRGACKNLVYEFKLKRCPGQPVVLWHKLRCV